ncbi:MAG: YceI family protein [Acidobacteriota bacterium]
MNTRLFAAAACTGALHMLLAAGNNTPVTVQVDSGNVQFDSATNFSAVSVHGKSGALKATVQAHQSGEEVVLEQVKAWLPVKALTTGMGLRDEHMRKYIFTTADGAMPDLRFTGENLHCPAQMGRETTCPVNGTLSVRGVERPFSLTLKVKQERSAPSQFKVSGGASLKLSDYGIERPSQLGVKTEDEVQLHLEFTARETPLSARVEATK